MCLRSNATLRRHAHFEGRRKCDVAHSAINTLPAISSLTWYLRFSRQEAPSSCRSDRLTSPLVLVLQHVCLSREQGQDVLLAVVCGIFAMLINSCASHVARRRALNSSWLLRRTEGAAFCVLFLLFSLRFPGRSLCSAFGMPA